MKTDPIDAVIAWVDGTDPKHIEARNSYTLTPNTTGDKNSGVNATRRWSCANELDICLRSLGRHAPWLRRIVVVTDKQMPACLESLPPELRAKVEVIDHKVLFKDYEDWLPTFNSMAVESMLWRIPDLAERFIYFNDDMFLGSRVEPHDFFQDDKTVIRGKWMNLPQEKQGSFTKSIYRAAKLNGATAMGFETRVFSSAHVALPMRVSVLKAIFETNPEILKMNAGSRFRDRGQYLVQSLFVHSIEKANRAIHQSTPQYQNFSSSYCRMAPRFVLRLNLWSIKMWPARFKLICVNDLQLLCDRFGTRVEVDIRRALGLH